MLAKKAIPLATTGKTLKRSEIMGRLAQRGTVGSELSRPKSVRVVASGIREPARHKYHAGETVTLVPTRYGANRHGRFEVMRLLPEEQGVNHYRLKSVTDGHERVAREDELA
jgi:hypothetical protein